MNSLTCIINGHLWQARSITEVWKHRYDGTPIKQTTTQIADTPFCLRCGKPNPNWTRHPK